MSPTHNTRHHAMSRHRQSDVGQGLRQMLAFALGCVLTAMMILNAQIGSIPATTPDAAQPGHGVTVLVPSSSSSSSSPMTLPLLRATLSQKSASTQEKLQEQQQQQQSTSVLQGKRILVGIAAYDFSQIPHLEEVLDGLHDLCIAGSYVDVYIHATVPYPVTLIDLLNTRHFCTNHPAAGTFRIIITLVSPSVKLHLVDYHRTLFYDKLDDYDIFIYTEDDIRIAPHTVSAYLYETNRIEKLVQLAAEGGGGGVVVGNASDFNVGFCRYEYNYPPSIVIDDANRHATANVTRVYWEHSWHPVIPKAVDAIPQSSLLSSSSSSSSQHPQYVHMQNHHQGMYMATRALLKAWRDRPGCHFDVIRDRPGVKGRPSQPSEGTQRVWMSSQMLYGTRHCNVQQVIPVDKFGEFTVLHLPNKNYRRVGRKGRLGGGKSVIPSQGKINTSTIEGPSSLLVSAMHLHIEFAKRWPKQPTFPYQGPVFMNNQGCDRPKEKVHRMMQEYQAYVNRGGVMSEDDMTKTNWLD